MIGKFGLGRINERIERLIEYFYNLFVASNPYFQLPTKTRITWKSQEEWYRNQLDYILTRILLIQNSKNNWLSYPEVYLDYNLFIKKVDEDLVIKKKWGKKKRKLNLQKLKEEPIWFKHKIEKKLESMKTQETGLIISNKKCKDLKEKLYKGENGSLVCKNHKSIRKWEVQALIDNEILVAINKFKRGNAEGWNIIRVIKSFTRK